MRARFFRPAGKKSFRVVDELREGIRWQVHDLTADQPPARDFHIVFLRNNLLTYYRREIVEAALPVIAGCLAPGGYLVIGRKERLPGFLEGFHLTPAVCLPVPDAGGHGVDKLGSNENVMAAPATYFLATTQYDILSYRR